MMAPEFVFLVFAQSNVGFLGIASQTLSFMGVRNAPLLNEHPAKFNIEGLFLDQKFMFHIMKTKLFVGVGRAADSINDFDNTDEQVA